MGKFWRLFRRGGSDRPASAPAVPVDPAVAAARFWESWTALLPKVSAALGEGDLSGLENELCELVTAVHPELHFAVERGQKSIYALVISGQGDPELRPCTDAWMAAAPPPNPFWEYYDAIPPVPDPTQVAVNLSGQRIDLAAVRVATQMDEPAGLVDVAVYHPKLAELDKAGRDAMTFLPLDATLGERLAADLLGRVETAEREPANAVGLLELRDLIRTLADSTTSNDAADEAHGGRPGTSGGDSPGSGAAGTGPATPAE